MSKPTHSTGNGGTAGGFRRLVRSRSTPVNNTSRREALLRKPDGPPRLQVSALAPSILDEDRQEVDGSTEPRGIPHRHPMIKVDPATNRIAHRELRVHVWSDGHPDGVHAGKTVVWTMEPLFVSPAGPGEPQQEPTFRGDWRLAAEKHRDRFQAATVFDSSGFVRQGQESATTVVGQNGLTAVRVNLPPVAFNAARISARLQGEEDAVALIDLEVPGIIVIDPGHGGDRDERSSTANNATSHTSGILEKDLTLDFGLRTRSALRASRTGENQNIWIHMTRAEDVNIAGPLRANIARDHGADILLSIHFNGFNGSARGTETLVRRSSDNVNFNEDALLARRVNDAVYRAILAHDPDARDRDIKERQLAALSDAALGNSAEYHPLRSALLEVEFIDNEAVDKLLSVDEGYEQVRQDIADALAAALLADLRSTP